MRVTGENVGEGKSRRSVSLRLSEIEVKKSVLSPKVIFREILVIMIYVVNVQDN